MKNIRLIFISNIKRNRGVVILSVLGGFILCFFIFFIGSYAADSLKSKIKIGIIDYDDSILSENFKSYLVRDLDYELIEHHSFDYLSKLLIDKDISVIIEIPEGFYEKFASGGVEKIIITSTDDFENAAFTEAYMNSYLASVHMLSVSSGGNEEAFTRYLDEYGQSKNPVRKAMAFDTEPKKFKEKEGFRNSVGFYLMIAFALAMVISFIIADDRRTGIYNRIAVTPVKAVHYIAGNSIFGFFLLLVETLIYCGYLAAADLNIGFPVYKLFLLMMLFSCFVTCFIIDASLLIKSKSGLTVLIMGFNNVGTILGGAYFALDRAPENLQNLARILPQFWITDAINKLVDNPGADILYNVIILTLFTVLAFLIGAVLFSQNYKRG